MPESGQGGPSQPEKRGEDAGAAPRLLPTAQQEVQFSFDNGLMAWSQIRDGLDIQMVMPDERTAVAIKELVETQHPSINDVVARQSPSQAGRWVVQMSAVLANKYGLLPKGIAYEDIKLRLCRGYMPTSAVDVYESRQVARTRHSGLRSWLKGFGRE